MDPTYLANLAFMLGNKPQLTGPEYMLYQSVCECLEQWVRYQTQKLKEGQEVEPSSDPSGSAQPDP